MPRQAREKSELGLYHIVEKGINGRALFYGEGDYIKYLNIVNCVREKSDFKIYAYCLMGNHVHILLEEGEEPLEVIFKRINVSYAQYYNLKNQRHGPLFQDRFWSEAVSDDEYFYDVIRYICQNPVKAGICDNPFEYKWIGCSGFVGDIPMDCIEKFSDISALELQNFVMQNVNHQHDDENRRKLTDSEALAELNNLLGNNTIAQVELISPEMRKKILVSALNKGVSIRQLSRLTGLSRYEINMELRKNQ